MLDRIITGRTPAPLGSRQLLDRRNRYVITPEIQIDIDKEVKRGLHLTAVAAMKQKLTERNCASLAKYRDPTLQTIWTTLTGVAAKVGGLSTKGFAKASKAW